MDFKLPILTAMREQAPNLFMELSRSGRLLDFADQMSRKAHQLFYDLTKDAPKTASGYPQQPWAREAEEMVFATFINFSSNDERSVSIDDLDSFISNSR